MHPLTPNLTELKDEELRQKITDLNSKLNHAYKFGNNHVVQQIYMLMEDYQAELSRRQQKQLDEIFAKNDKFKDLIDVKK